MAVNKYGPGMPAAIYLDAFGAVCADFFGCHVYHVGSSLVGKAFRDVDVRAILDDDVYAALGLGDPEATHSNRRWVALVLAFSALGEKMTGLPVDFQIQQQTYANKKFSRETVGELAMRSALGLHDLLRHESKSPPDLFEERSVTLSEYVAPSEEQK